MSRLLTNAFLAGLVVLSATPSAAQNEPEPEHAPEDQGEQ
jgi:hypothetical protein